MPQGCGTKGCMGMRSGLIGDVRGCRRALRILVAKFTRILCFLPCISRFFWPLECYIEARRCAIPLFSFPFFPSPLSPSSSFLPPSSSLLPPYSCPMPPGFQSHTLLNPKSGGYSVEASRATSRVVALTVSRPRPRCSTAIGSSGSRYHQVPTPSFPPLPCRDRRRIAVLSVAALSSDDLASVPRPRTRGVQRGGNRTRVPSRGGVLCA